MSERSIRSAKVSEAERCFAVLTLAFAGDPAARWAWPDQQQYLDAFPRFARAFGGAPSMPELPIMLKASLVWPCGCRRGHRRMRHPLWGLSRTPWRMN